MKKTKLLYSFAIFCIVLSFFSVAQAAGNKITFTTGYFLNNKEEPDKGARYTENDYQIWYGQRDHVDTRQVIFDCNETGVYTITLRREDDKLCEDFEIFSAGNWSDGGAAKHVGLACFKNGDDYELYSPVSSNGNTVVTVYLEAGQSYEIANWEKNIDGILDIYYNPEYNKRDNYDSGISSYVRTKKGNKYSVDDPNSGGGYHASSKMVPDSSKLKYDLDSQVNPNNNGIEGTTDIFEKHIVRLLLTVGDFFVKLLGDIIGQEITIFKILFNGHNGINISAINPNFFKPENRSTIGDIDVSQIISDWYMFFRGVAFTFYVLSLLGVGIHVLLNSTAKGIQKAKAMLTEWLKGILLLVFMPICIKYLFEFNDAIVQMILDNDSTVSSMTSYSLFTDGNEWAASAIEFRSPEYVSRYTGRIAFGSDESNESYINKLSEYQQSFDLMRICRAYAGATFRLGYTLVWYVLIGQLIVFLVIYFKRYFTIVFLIAAFPIVCLFHSISLMRGISKGPEITNWFKKIVENIFIQSIHCIIYALITGVCIGLFQNAIQGNAGGINWILMIVAINFIPEGEKILKRVLNSIGGSGGGMKEAGKGIKGAIGRVTSNARKMMSGSGGK